MAKKKIIKKGEHLKLEIAKCKRKYMDGNIEKTCNGNPPTSSLDIRIGFEGVKCNICYRVISYEKLQEVKPDKED